MPGLMQAMTRFVLDRYDRRSVIAFVLLVALASSVGYRWNDLVDLEGGMDWLLAGIWVVMAALICWNVDPRRDLVLFGTGLCGGAVIEWWGTTTLLWSYFTDERPPLWILPAWPCAAISIDRLGQIVDRLFREIGLRSSWPAAPRAYAVAYWIVMPAFVVWMTHFLSPAIAKPASVVVIAIMLAVALRCRDPRRDVVVFIAGSSLGVFLEYWGTSRECWTYYTRETPPAVAVLAHGFAAVAFARVADAVDGAFVRLTFLPSWLRSEG